jgi:hypothetical protein
MHEPVLGAGALHLKKDQGHALGAWHQRFFTKGELP